MKYSANIEASVIFNDDNYNLDNVEIDLYRLVNKLLEDNGIETEYVNISEVTLLPIQPVETLPEGCFQYGNLCFLPYRKFSAGEIALSLKSFSNYISSDPDIMRNIVGYSYDDFYRESGNSDCDVFKCLNNGALYVPGNNELFRYIKNEF